jgi:predicted RNA-binding protein with PUA-like domain
MVGNAGTTGSGNGAAVLINVITGQYEISPNDRQDDLHADEDAAYFNPAEELDELTWTDEEVEAYFRMRKQALEQWIAERGEQP